MKFVCFNGEIIPADQPLFTAQNRGFRYGDGVFETIKVHKANIALASLHFERLFLSLQLLKIQRPFEGVQLTEMILELCQKNECTALARVRLAVCRKDENKAEYVIEAFPLLEEVNRWNETGFKIDVYPYARKSKDALANLKSANFLPYVLAGLHAQENGFDDCLILNCDNKIADASKANIFLIKNSEVFTPALHQGCINGVMRKFLIDELKKHRLQVHQREISETDLIEADELFLTNAIYGIRWIRTFKQKEYLSGLTNSIYHQLVSTIYK
jgi:branched-chain amino acid aminotransferase